MKSAYELAMERLNRTAPSQKLSDHQKTELAELDAVYKAKLAELEIRFRDDITAAETAGDQEKAEELRRHLASDRARIQEQCEAKKNAVRARAK